MINKDENNDINKEESQDPAEKTENTGTEENISDNPVHKKRGRPKKVSEEVHQEEIKDEKAPEQMKENPEPEKEKMKEEEKTIEQEMSKESSEEKAEESDFTEEETEEIKLITSTEKINKKSNYQISLLDENHLRAKVMTNKLVAVLCSVKDKYTTELSSGERQTNKIFIHPKDKPQEVEIMLSVGTPLIPGQEMDSAAIKTDKESNYQVSLVDENLLRVFVVTEKSVSIDCLVKDEDVHADGSNESQANRIFIHPKEKAQEVEIIITIGSAALAKQTEAVTIAPERKTEENLHRTKLTPNPIVANLIQKFSDKEPDSSESASLTPEERLEEKLGPKNPWRIYKELMLRNLIAGLAGAVLIYIITIISFYTILSKKNNNADVVEAPRLIVMQDLPENQFLQQNVEDPNKPKEEIKESEDGANTNKIPPIIPKKVKPPRVIGPTKTKTDTNDLTKELDSLRNVNKNITNNGKNPNDTSRKNITSGNFPIPDSVMRNLKDNEVGLVGRFPPNWKQIDSREVNLSKEFTGVLLVDTVPEKKAERLTMNVQIDKNNEYWKQFNFKNVFQQDDSTKNTIYNIEPKQEGDQTYYRFYISGMAYNIYIAAFINNEHFEKRKPEIEQVVRTIRIQKPGTPPGK
ncbi:MAG: hypothetical protein HY959_07355 [Ignavibacteriae bacterium]|nr:hypothetical protein [Ignavibacteriota bacterium]